jgi:hypothetical protein
MSSKIAVKHVNIAIRRDELTVLHTTVAEWEVPLLHLVHNEGAVSVREGSPVTLLEQLPTVEDEYARLANRYKLQINEDGSRGQPIVSMVYGPFGASPLLRQAMQAAVVEAPPDLLGDVQVDAPEQSPEMPVEEKQPAKGKKPKAASKDAGTTTAPASLL